MCVCVCVCVCVCFKSTFRAIRCLIPLVFDVFPNLEINTPERRRLVEFSHYYCQRVQFILFERDQTL